MIFVAPCTYLLSVGSTLHLSYTLYFRPSFSRASHTTSTAGSFTRLLSVITQMFLPPRFLQSCQKMTRCIILKQNNQIAWANPQITASGKENAKQQLYTNCNWACTENVSYLDLTICGRVWNFSLAWLFIWHYFHLR